jgi:hypothetical protein
MNSEAGIPEQQHAAAVSWQWRSGRWKIALGAFAIIGIVGGNAIRYGTEAYKWEYNFIVILLLAFAIGAAFTDRDWPVWKRIMWIFGLWILHGFMQFIPFGMITGILTMGMVSNATVSALILVLWAMRRSTFFVEPVALAAPVKLAPLETVELPVSK